MTLKSAVHAIGMLNLPLWPAYVPALTINKAVRQPQHRTVL